MLSGNYISYKTIMENVMRNFGFHEIADEEALEWLSAFMDHTKVPKVLEDKIAYLDVQNGRAQLPCDMCLIRQSAYLDGVDNVVDAECGSGDAMPMRWATTTFHLTYHCEDSSDFEQDGIYTYTLNKGFIYPNFEEGIIMLNYKAIPTDDAGYPLIPSDEQWRKAAEFEIAYRYAYRAMIKDEITAPKFQLIERDRDWYFSQAVNYSKTSLPLDEMESFKNDTLRTIPDPNMHSNFFRNMQLPERRVFRPQSGAQDERSNIRLTTSPNIDTTG
jgi:hypothetical protein